MTQNQIEKLRDELNEKYYGDGCRLPQYAKMPITKEDNIAFIELDIRDMMLSCLAYGEDYFEMIKSYWYTYNTSKFDWQKLEDAGVKNGQKRVEELWKEMKDDFNKYANVEKDTYTDSEGLSYNSLSWTK